MSADDDTQLIELTLDPITVPASALWLEDEMPDPVTVDAVVERLTALRLTRPLAIARVLLPRQDVTGGAVHVNVTRRSEPGSSTPFTYEGAYLP